MIFNGFYQMLNSVCESFADNTAIIYDDNGFKRSVSYCKLFSAVSRRAEEFRAIKKNCVGIFENSGKRFIVDTLAAVIAGKQTVLINHSLDEAALQRLVDYADVNYLCTDEITEKTARKIKLSDTAIQKAEGEGDILFFTAGTTGHPRAAVLTPSKLCIAASCWQESVSYDSSDMVLSLVPAWHIYGFMCNLLCVLTSGATVAINRGAHFLTTDLKYFNPTIIVASPAILNRLLDKNSFNKNLKRVLVGAGLADMDAIVKAEAYGLKVQVAYGLTEVSGGVACSKFENQNLLCICSNCRVGITDEGEIMVQSAQCMMKGYYKLSLDTAEVIAGGVLFTGDVGALENGKLIIFGKKNELLDVNGEKIYLPKLEEQLSEVLSVEDCAVIKRGDALTVVCVDVLGKLTSRELNKKLNAFNKTQPHNLRIEKIELRTVALPRNAIGKIKRWLI